jgi:SAM-dependent methyltransferase
MSCLFGLLGAEVTGVELPNVSLTMARKEVERWNLVDRVTLVNYSGNPADIPGHEYDFIFTKSVLVVIPYLESFVREVSKKMKSGGEFIAAENLKGGHMLRLIRYLLHPKWQRQYGVDSHFIDVFNRVFKDVQVRRYWGLVAAIRAQK